MKQALTGIALLTLTALAAPAAAAQAPFEGRWTNPKKSVIIEVAPCGSAHCGTVVWATPKTKANARKGGTEQLIGTRLITGLRPDGKGGFKGTGFVPKRNIHAPATIRPSGPNTMIVKGCVLGLICKEQRWTRVDS
jgi:uncharacterized protein (DUF2147 family)